MKTAHPIRETEGLSQPSRRAGLRPIPHHGMHDPVECQRFSCTDRRFLPLSRPISSGRQGRTPTREPPCQPSLRALPDTTGPRSRLQPRTRYAGPSVKGRASESSTRRSGRRRRIDKGMITTKDTHGTLPDGRHGAPRSGTRQSSAEHPTRRVPPETEVSFNRGGSLSRRRGEDERTRTSRASRAVRRVRRPEECCARSDVSARSRKLSPTGSPTLDSRFSPARFATAHGCHCVSDRRPSARFSSSSVGTTTCGCIV